MEGKGHPLLFLSYTVKHNLRPNICDNLPAQFPLGLHFHPHSPIVHLTPMTSSSFSAFHSDALPLFTKLSLSVPCRPCLSRSRLLILLISVALCPPPKTLSLTLTHASPAEKSQRSTGSSSPTSQLTAWASAVCFGLVSLCRLCAPLSDWLSVRRACTFSATSSARTRTY